MQHVKLSLDQKTILTGRRLASRYGRAASLSAVVRRAVRLLDDEWRRISAEPQATEAERLAMVDFLSEARRGSAL